MNWNVCWVHLYVLTELIRTAEMGENLITLDFIRGREVSSLKLFSMHYFQPFWRLAIFSKLVWNNPKCYHFSQLTSAMRICDVGWRRGGGGEGGGGGGGGGDKEQDILTYHFSASHSFRLVQTSVRFPDSLCTLYTGVHCVFTRGSGNLTSITLTEGPSVSHSKKIENAPTNRQTCAKLTGSTLHLP